MRKLTPNQQFLRRAILSGDTHSPAVAKAYELERQAMRLEDALRHVRRAGHIPKARRTV